MTPNTQKLISLINALKTFITTRVDDTIQRRELFHRVDTEIERIMKEEGEPNEFGGIKDERF